MPHDRRERDSELLARLVLTSLHSTTVAHYCHCHPSTAAKWRSEHGLYKEDLTDPPPEYPEINQERFTPLKQVDYAAEVKEVMQAVAAGRMVIREICHVPFPGEGVK